MGKFWDPINTTLGAGHLIARAPEGVHVCVAGTNLSMGWCPAHQLAFEELAECPQCLESAQAGPGGPESEKRQDGPDQQRSAQPGPAGARRRANGDRSTPPQRAAADPAMENGPAERKMQADLQAPTQLELWS